MNQNMTDVEFIAIVREVAQDGNARLGDITPPDMVPTTIAQRIKAVLGL